MNDTTPPPTPPSGAPDNGPTGTSNSQGFFAWLRNLGIVRGQERWFAGVAGGIAAKANIDPLIVRGIFVVLAILGGPGILLYLAGWLLLPDTNGRIHVEDLIRGRASAGVIVAVVILGALIFIPALFGILPGVFSGPWMWDVWGIAPEWVGITFNVIWWAIIVPALVIWLIVWASRGGLRGQRSEASPAPTPDAPPYEAASTGPNPAAPAPTPHAATFVTNADGSTTAWNSAPETASASEAASLPHSSGMPDASGAPAAAGAPDTTEPPSADTTFSDRAAGWAEQAGARAGEWGEEFGRKAEEWGQKMDEKSREWEQKSKEYVESTRPSAALVVISVACALLAGGLAAVWAISQSLSGNAVLTAGLVAATAVLGISMIIAGIRGRGTGWVGFLAFVGVIALIFAPFTTILPQNSQFIPFGNVDIRVDADSSEEAVVMIAGNSTIDLTQLTRTDSPREVDLWLAGGNVTVVLPPSHPVAVHVDLMGGNVKDLTVDEEDVRRGVLISHTIESGVSSTAASRVTDVRIRLLGGNVTVEGGSTADTAEIIRLQQEIAELEQQIRAEEEARQRTQSDRDRLEELQEELENAR